jgi:hypothetical protein
MKSIGEILEPKKVRPKAKLNKKMKIMFMNWAQEAHELDKSRSVLFYYEQYILRLREKYRECEDKKEFFKNGIIEV